VLIEWASETYERYREESSRIDAASGTVGGTAVSE
jgi:hypothetical protein